MAKKDTFEQIVEEAQGSFDLRQRLLGIAPLTKKVTVYTDAATGKELGGAEDQKGQGGIVLSRRRWGVQGRLEEIGLRAEALGKQEDLDEDDPEIAALEKEMSDLQKKAKTLLAKLDKSALSFTIRAVPELVIRDCRRKAKQNLGIKGKGVQGQEEEYGLEYTALLLSASVEKWVDHASGDTHLSLSEQQARDLRDFLPAGQFARLDAAMIEVSFEAQIGATYGTDDADF